MKPATTPPPPPPPADLPKPPVTPTAPAQNDEAAIRAKIRDGLTRDQAVEVLAAQKAHEAAQKPAK